MKLKMVFGLVLFLISFSVFADTYSAILKNNCNYNPAIGLSGTDYTNTAILNNIGECKSIYQGHIKGPEWTFTITSNQVIGWAYGNNQGSV